MLMSGSSLAISHNTYAKMYNGADMITILTTEKSMKKHAYTQGKKYIKELAEAKAMGKKFIVDYTKARALGIMSTH